jgi:hypothetical protein
MVVAVDVAVLPTWQRIFVGVFCTTEQIEVKGGTQFVLLVLQLTADTRRDCCVKVNGGAVTWKEASFPVVQVTCCVP